MIDWNEYYNCDPFHRQYHKSVLTHLQDEPLSSLKCSMYAKPGIAKDWISVAVYNNNFIVVERLLDFVQPDLKHLDLKQRIAAFQLLET